MARLFAHIAALVLGIFAFANVGAQTYTYTFYVGNTNASGCTVSTPAGPVDHVKWRLQATVTAGVSPQFGSVTRADCSNNVFGSPSAVTSTSAVGLNTGVGGADVIEVQVPIGVIGPTPSPREVLAVVASSNTASDALISTLPPAKSEAKGVPQPPTLIPSLSLGGIVLLGLALIVIGWYALRRYAHILPLSLLLVAGTAWAVAIVIDGQVGDWATVTPSTDPTGDVAQSGIDLVRLYTTTQASNGYLRVDVVDLQNPPVANAGSATLLEDGNTTITLTGSDPNNAPLTFQIVTPPTRGSLGPITPINATSASVQYTANADEFGADSFTFKVGNGTQMSLPATVAITITPVNDAPSFTATDPPAVNEGAGAQTVPAWASFTPGPANESSQVALEYVVSAIGNPALFASAPTVDASGTLSYTLAANANGSSSFSVAVRDDGGTANGGVDLSASQNFTVTVNAVNAAPSFVGGGDVSALEDAGAQTVAGWATAIDDGDPEQAQTLTFAVSANTNPALFFAGPSVDAVSGDLSYTAAPDANGSAQITLVLSDDAGTANGGSDTSAPVVFNVQVTAVNDAPSFTAVDPPAVNEGGGAQTVPNWAAFDPGPADESGQAVLEYAVSAIGNPALFTAAPSVAVDGTLSYTVAPNVSGSSSFTVTVRDDGGTANGGIDLSAGQSFTVTVNAVNSAPTFVGGGDVASNEDAGAQTVLGWATAIDDGDPDQVQTLTFAVTANTNPTLFSASPAVDAISGNLTYTAVANASGSATITLQLSDNGGTANGGSDTSAPYNFTITVNPTNDAPTATAKAHTTHSAIELEIIAASHTGELLEGATDPDDPIGDLTAVFVAGSATPAGAQVTITNASDGSFRYDPPGGYSGAGSFQFRICDDGVPAAPQQCSAATTVSFTVTGPDLYFVDDNATPGGDGGLNDPFDELSDLPAGRGNNDRIFVFAGSYPTAVHSFFVGEHLVGQGATGAFDTVLGVTVPGNGALDARPALTGVVGDRPALNRIVMAGATGATMRGVALSTASSESVFINGTTGVTVSESSAASSISGVNINSSSASAEGVTFTNVTSTGGLNGIVLNNLVGTFNFGAGSLTGNTGVSFLATGTLGATTYGGAITKTANGNLVEITGAAAGTVTLSGDLTCSNSCDGIDVLNRGAGTITFSGTTKTLNTGASTAVNLDNNDATTIDFTGGGLDIDTTAGAGFNAVNGATAITVQTGASANTIVSGTGIALAVANTTIGAAGLTFQSISASGASSGIVLNTTGADGGLTVTGNGGVCTIATPTCTGGTLQGHTDAGINLVNTRNISLSLMRVNGGTDDGIRGSSVTNFALASSVVSGNGNALGDNGLDFSGLFGNASLTNTAIVQSHHNNILVRNTAGTLTLLSISGSTISNNVSTADGDGILFEASGTANMSVNVSGSSFAAHLGDHFQAAALNSAVLDVALSGNTMSGGHASPLGQGITINAASALPGFSGSVTYSVDGNTINGSISSSIVLALGTSAAGSSMVGEVKNNLIGTSGVVLSCSMQANGISVDARGNGTVTALVENNTIRQCFDRGMLSEAGDGDSTLNLTVRGNVSDQQVAPGARESIQTNHGITSLNVFGNTDTNVVCLELSGNTFSHGAGAPDDFRLRKRHEATVRLPGYVGGTGQDLGSLGQVVAFIRGQNVGSAGEPGSATATGAGGGYTGGAACPLPL